MNDWYKRGFSTNIVISILGILIASFEFVLYSVNRRAYFKLGEKLNELKNMQIPQTVSYRMVNSKTNSQASIYTPIPTQANTDLKRVPLKVPMRNFYNLNNDESDGDTELHEISNNKKRIYDDADGRPDEKEWM